MKLLLALLAVAVVVGTIYADYRWRTWMAARRQERDHDPDPRA